MVDRSDRQAGETASVEELRRRLASAPPAFVLGALRNPSLKPGLLRLLLRNRRAPAEALEAIAEDPRWTRHHELRGLLAQHPNVSLALGRRWLPHLFWKQLAELALTPTVNPVLRHEAERALELRIEEMSEGERIALARRARGGIVDALAEAGESSVLAALLDNPRLIEPVAERIAGSQATPPTILGRLAEHARWKGSRPIRLALAANPSTPVRDALRAIQELPRRDLEALSGDPRVPGVVRVAADRRIRGGSGPATAATGPGRDPA